MRAQQHLIGIHTNRSSGTNQVLDNGDNDDYDHEIIPDTSWFHLYI